MTDYEQGYQDACKAAATMLRAVSTITTAAAEPEGVECPPSGDASDVLAMVAGAMSGAARTIEDHASARLTPIAPR